MPDRNTVEAATLAQRFFKDAQDTQRPVSMYLVNGFQLKGEVVAFDSETVLFKHKEAHQLVMRSAVATMYPLPNPKLDAGQWWLSYESTVADE